MRLLGRRGQEPEGAVVSIQESTLARAGDAATRVALEETLFRRGWRVLFFEDQFGPLVGPERPKLFDGIAVRVRPGTEAALELRLLRVESDTLEVSPDVLERVKRAAREVSLEWLVAAFDGEAMRLVPELEDAGVAAVRPGTAVRPAAAAPAPSPPPSGLAARAAAGKRRRPRGKPADAPVAADSSRPAPVAAAPPTRAPAAATAPLAAESQPAAGGRHGRRRGGRGKGGAASAGQPATDRPAAGRTRERGRPSGSAEERAKSTDEAAPGRRGRRRGKRGGRRRSGAPGA